MHDTDTFISSDQFGRIQRKRERLDAHRPLPESAMRKLRDELRLLHTYHSLNDTEKMEHPIRTATFLHHKLSQFESKTRILICSENRKKMALEQTSIAGLHQRTCENKPL